MSTLRNKVVTDLRKAKRIVRQRPDGKRDAWRRYRRHVRQLDHCGDSVNYEPSKSKRWTDYDAC